MKKQQGFSLIELLIVVGIIGAISAIAVPTYASYKKKSDVAAAVASVKSLLTSAELHIAEGGTNGLVSFVESVTGNTNSYDVGLGKIVGTNAVAGQNGAAGTPGNLTFTFNTGQSFATKTIIFTRGDDAWTCKAHADIKKEINDLVGCS